MAGVMRWSLKRELPQISAVLRILLLFSSHDPLSFLVACRSVACTEAQVHTVLDIVQEPGTSNI
jgi:hypothetical protein